MVGHLRIPKLKTGDPIEMLWRDSVYSEGPRNPDNLPTPVTIRSVGVFVAEQDDALVMAGDDTPDHGDYRYVHATLKINIQKIRKLR